MTLMDVMQNTMGTPGSISSQRRTLGGSWVGMTGDKRVPSAGRVVAKLEGDAAL